MKRFNIAILSSIIVLASYAFPLDANAQERVVEHNIKFGLGVFHHDNTGGFTALSISYGSDLYFNNHWSVMPEVSYRFMSNGINITNRFGGWLETFRYVDLGVNLRCHLGENFIISLAPTAAMALTRRVDADSGYYSDAIVDRWDFGARLAAEYAFSTHWRLGLESYYGTSQVARLNATVCYAIF